MIRVELAPEPPDFAEKVRKPGLNALALLRGQPAPYPRKGRPPKATKKLGAHAVRKSVRDFPYWTRALDQLHEAYGGICAYAGFYIEKLCLPHVDHFVALHTAALAGGHAAETAYDWKNYRLACGYMNACKKDFPDVLDPAAIQDGWFQLNLDTFKLHPSPELEAGLQHAVRETIRRLKLDDTDVKELRRRYFNDYWYPPPEKAPLPFWLLARDCPFVAKEMLRQGRVRPEDLLSPHQTAAIASP